ncbi:hypothetical protein ACFSFZ_10300 [Mixta tenebrionis]|uniref:Uncharacterized protein n=1 Tax=Mixta tenebrionis TaxID=2562439 RepID=A0A506VAX1_9GAMM|nr:hypothetical protein [Mixta tenebrionis]TPW42626.1 hypothetical protein FKM52_07530 [Mixta tenebrionis]
MHLKNRLRLSVFNERINRLHQLTINHKLHQIAAVGTLQNCASSGLLSPLAFSGLALLPLMAFTLIPFSFTGDVFMQ